MDEDANRIEMWKVVRGAIRDIIDDRNFHTRLYLTIILATYIAYGFLWNFISTERLLEIIYLALITLPILSVIVSLRWSRHMKTFERAIGARYKALNEIERNLPEKPFTRDAEIRLEIDKNQHKTMTSRLLIDFPIYFVFVGIFLTILTIFTLYQDVTDARG